MYQNILTCNYKIERDFDSVINKEIEILIINCEKCPFSYNNKEINIFNKQCFNNLVKLLMKNPSLTKINIKTQESIFNLTENQVDLFSDYGKQLRKIYSDKKLTFLIERYDCISRKDCENKQNFFFERIMGNNFNDGLLISNPISTYIEILQKINIYDQLSAKKSECRDCQKTFIHFLSNIRDFLYQTKIIQSYLLLDNKKKELPEIYSIILGDYNLTPENLKTNLNLYEFDESNSTFYKVGPYTIKISWDSQSKEYFYIVSSIIDDPNLKKIYVKLMKEIKTNSADFFVYEKPQKLNYLLQYMKNCVIQFIKKEFGYLSEQDISDLAELMMFELINLNPFMALLIDDKIEEVFLDSPKSFIYLDHRQFGRCQTHISLTSTEIESFKTRIRMEAEQRLDEIQPFLKTEIITQYFHVRITAQIYPLSVDGFSMNIRKFQEKILTLIDLIENNTLSIEAAAYLLFNLIHGRCILVIGEPFSGKTTLINSLDMFGKRNWRKIYIEDVIESIDQSPYDIHQLRFQVDPFIENSESYLLKSFQVKECLHRTPDFIFIGELIHPKSVEAYFFLLKVGLRRCLATSHGESPELMIERFIYDDKIPPTLIGNLDIIVQINRINNGGKVARRVTRITEVKKETQFRLNTKVNHLQNDLNVTFNDIFLRNPETDHLVSSFNSLQELYNKSEIIKEINSLRSEYISDNNFIIEITHIMNFLDDVLKGNKRDLTEIIKMTHRFWQNLELSLNSKNFSRS